MVNSENLTRRRTLRVSSRLNEDSEDNSPDEVLPTQNGMETTSTPASSTSDTVPVRENCCRVPYRTFEEMPEWSQDNRHIKTGYRHDLSWKQAFISLFQFHNESMNVWTHLFGFFFMGFLLYCYIMFPENYNPEFALSYAKGSTVINRGVHFVFEMFGYEWDWHKHRDGEMVLSYHETMPSFCESYYQQYHEYIAYNNSNPNTNINVNSYVNSSNSIPTTTTDLSKEKKTDSKPQLFMHGKPVLAPWQFPAQCKPLSYKIFDRSFAKSTREYLQSLPANTQAKLRKLKTAAKNVFSHVPLPSSLKHVVSDVYQNIGEQYGKAKNSVGLYIDDVSSAALANLETNTQNVQEAAVGLYAKLLKILAPIAMPKTDNTPSVENLSQVAEVVTFEDGVADARALKHPAFLLSYLDTGDEYFTYLPRWPIFLYMVSAMICFGLSAFFHLFSAVSHDVYKILVRLDMSGISVLIWGSNVPIIVYTFYCDVNCQAFYVGLITLGCATTFYISTMEKFQHYKYKTFKTTCFVAVGLFGALPMIHQYFFTNEFNSVTFYYLLLMGATYIGGAMVYVTQIPESVFPGKFDVCCSSHQWWHCFVFAAAMVHYVGIMFLYNFRIVNTCVDLVGAQLLL